MNTFSSPSALITSNPRPNYTRNASYILVLREDRLMKAIYRGLGAEIARKFAAQGCNVAINYANNAQPAHDLANELQSSFSGIKTTVIAGDAGKQADCRKCVDETISAFGGLDVVIANAGWTKFTDFTDLEAMTEDEWDKCWATNVKGPKFLLSAALPTFKANADGGAMIITSSVAAQSLGGSSMAYSVTKAAQVHLMKCMAQTQGKMVRINAVLPGLLLTDWGNMYGEERINAINDRAALKKEVSGAVNSGCRGTFQVATADLVWCRLTWATARKCSSRLRKILP